MEAMAGAIWSFARDKVPTFLIKVVNTLKAVPNRVEEIKQELERIEADINVTDRMAIYEQENNSIISNNIGGSSSNNNNNKVDGIKTKVRQLTEAACRIEDVIEEYNMTSVEQQQQLLPCDILADLIQPKLNLLRISYEIEGIKSSVGKINGRSEGSGSSSTGSQEVTRHELREAARYIAESEVVGFEAPRDELERWLSEERKERTVIAVVGMGGQGKTTLAKTVYEKVHKQFDCYAWITVSESQTVEGLLRDMLKKFWETKGEAQKDISMDLGKLIDEVRNYLQHKRYVVLFDDVWNINVWSKIQSALFDNKMRSRVLITTRSKGVALICKEFSFVHIHELKPLSEEKSWELFRKKAFHNHHPAGLCPPGFENISRNIVKKCDGLPLALLAIGGLLAYKEKHEWQKLDDTLISELEKRPQSTGIMYILGLSYDALPYCLQKCFLHFGIYPEHYEVESATLIRKWIAEGFVKNQQDKTFEEVAEQYLEELINRSLVQVSSFSSDGKSKRCRVHDLLREIILAKFKGSSFCHFVCEADQADFSGMIRHLIISTDSNNAVVPLPIERSRIRSVYIFRGVELPEDFLRKILTIYKLLRVLDFEHAPLNNVPECWGNFYHLRYLSFRKTGVASLPKSIGNLHSLETLDLRQTRVRQMPREINKLRKLRHLLANHTGWFFNNGIQMMKEDIEGLESLQTLRQLETDQGGEELIRELKKLRQLRSLGLINVKKEHGEALCSSIVMMHKLEKLYLDPIKFDEVMDFDNLSAPLLHKLRIRGKIERLPNWISNLKNLVNLSLISSNLTSDPLISLQDMPTLFFLSLDSAYEGERLDFQAGKFRQLKKLSLRHLHNLNSIHIGEGALQSLEVLVLEFIPQLFEVPFDIKQLVKLEVFHIISMPDEFREAIEESDWIRNHVRQVKVADSFRRDYWDLKTHYS